MTAAQTRPVRDPAGTRGPWGHTPDEVLSVIASDGIRLHVEIDAPALTARSRPRPAGAAPTVVLIHGFTLSMSCWVLQRRALIHSGFRVVTYDQRSHGRSGLSAPENCTIDQLGRDLAAVLDAACPSGPLVLVAHSMGGMGLMAWGGAHADVVKERVLAAAFVATSAGGPHPLTDLGLGPAFGRVVSNVGPGVLNRLGRHASVIRQVRRLGQGIQNAIVERWAFDSPVSRELVEFVGEQIFLTPFEVIGDFLPAIQELDEVDSLAAFSGVETLVLNGAGDLVTPPLHSEEIVRGIPGAEHVVIEDAGHVVMLEHPQIVTQQLLMLIQRAQRAQATGVDVSEKPWVRRKITDLRKARTAPQGRRARRARTARADIES